MDLNRQAENDRILREAWVVDTPLPPRFQEQVWQRIAQQKARPKPTLATIRDLLTQVIHDVLPRPALAWSYAVVLLLLGAVGGSVAAQRQNTHLDTVLGSRYVRSLDP